MMKQRSTSKVLKEIDLKHERMAERKVEKYAPKTGYQELDNIIQGFVAGHTYLLSGETNSGKTSMAANFAVKVDEQMHRKVLYVALEPKSGILDFFVAIRGKKKFSEIEEEDYDEHWGGIDIMTHCRKVGELINILKKLPQDAGYDLIIIDHIGYFVTSQSGHLQEQSNIMKQLAEIAKEKRVAIMPIAHVRKQQGKYSRKKVLHLDDISGSGALKQDATEVLMLQRYYVDADDEENDELMRMAYLRVLKTKKGRTGNVKLYFQFDSPLVKSETEEKYL